MKGIILAGGMGSRLYPLTKTINKHLLPVGPAPMIHNPLKNMAMCGIEEVLITTSARHMGDIVNNLGSGAEFGLDLTYKVQESAAGIADALRLARNFAGDESVFVLLGDNIFERPVCHFIENYKLKQTERGARVLLVRVDEPNQFGVAALDEQNIIEIQEKPEKPKSDYAVVGAYLYDNQVWEIIDNLVPSVRGEYEITDVNNAYIERHSLQYDFVVGRWMDTGTFESYARANEMMFALAENESINSHDR